MPTTTTNWSIVKPASGAEPADLVFVRFTDDRSRLGFAWVDAGDVKRR